MLGISGGLTVWIDHAEPHGRVVSPLRLCHQFKMVPPDIYHSGIEQDRCLQEQAAKGECKASGCDIRDVR